MARTLGTEYSTATTTAITTTTAAKTALCLAANFRVPMHDFRWNPSRRLAQAAVASSAAQNGRCKWEMYDGFLVAQPRIEMRRPIIERMMMTNSAQLRNNARKIRRKSTRREQRVPNAENPCAGFRSLNHGPELCFGRAPFARPHCATALLPLLHNARHYLHYFRYTQSDNPPASQQHQTAVWKRTLHRLSCGWTVRRIHRLGAPSPRDRGLNSRGHSLGYLPRLIRGAIVEART